MTRNHCMFLPNYLKQAWSRATCRTGTDEIAVRSQPFDATISHLNRKKVKLSQL